MLIPCINTFLNSLQSKINGKMQLISARDSSQYGIPANATLPYNKIKSNFQKMIKDNLPSTKLYYLEKIFELINNSLPSEVHCGKE